MGQKDFNDRSSTRGGEGGSRLAYGGKNNIRRQERERSGVGCQLDRESGKLYGELGAAIHSGSVKRLQGGRLGLQKKEIEGEVAGVEGYKKGNLGSGRKNQGKAREDLGKGRGGRRETKNGPSKMNKAGKDCVTMNYGR